jgi:hypothetical protein
VTFTTQDLPGETGTHARRKAEQARQPSCESARAEIARIDGLRAQGLALTPETDAAYNEAVEYLRTDTAELLKAANDAVEKCKPGDPEIEEIQHNVKNAVANLEGCLQALRSARKDDRRNRMLARRALKACENAGIPADELPTLPYERTKMSDIYCAGFLVPTEGGMSRTWSGGA